MKEFDLSDKELKSLLQDEGIEEPSMGFNKAVLNKIEAYEKRKVEPIRAPKWLIFSLLALLMTPLVYMLATQGLNLSDGLVGFQMPSMELDLGISSTYIWISVLTVAVIWMAVIFDRFLLKTSDTHR